MNAEENRAAPIFFVCVFFFWTLLGIATTAFRDTKLFFEIAGFYVDYGQYSSIISYYFIFIAGLAFGLLTIKTNPIGYRVEQSPRSLEQAGWLALFAAMLLLTYRLIVSGAALTSGDYNARFLDDANIVLKVFPTVLTIVAGQLFWQALNNSHRIKIWRILATLFAFSALSIATASRSAAFYISIMLTYCIFTIGRSESPRWRGLNGVFNVVILLSVYYILGQIVNIWRWFALDGSFEDMILAVVGDSFPEFRSHALAEIQTQVTGTMNGVGWSDWLRNLVPYFIPGPIYEIVGLSRQQEFNWLWKNHFEQLFWMGNEAAYGLRTGLVGETALVMGNAGCMTFGFLSGAILKYSRHKLLAVVCLCGTVPYGATAIYLYGYCLVLHLILSYGSKMLMTPRSSCTASIEKPKNLCRKIGKNFKV